MPRTEQYKTKWTMLIGLIHDPTEPKSNINTYILNHMVANDLNKLRNGALLETNG